MNNVDWSTTITSTITSSFPKIAIDADNANDAYTYSFEMVDGSPLPAGFTYDQANASYQRGAFAVGTYNLKLKAVDNNSCGDAAGTKFATSTFIIRKYYFNTAPTWVSEIAD